MSEPMMIVIAVVAVLCCVGVWATCTSGGFEGTFDWRTDIAMALGPAPSRTVDRETVADVIDLLQWELELAPA